MKRPDDRAIDLGHHQELARIDVYRRERLQVRWQQRLADGVGGEHLHDTRQIGAGRPPKSQTIDTLLHARTTPIGPPLPPVTSPSRPRPTGRATVLVSGRLNRHILLARR